MKTISGGINSSTPVSVSEAAAFLFKFISSETGASQAVNAYLRRANSTFDELVRLHSRNNRKKHRQLNEESKTKFSTRSVEVNQERSQTELTLETKTRSGLEESEGRMGTELEEEQSNLEETANRLKKKKKEKEKNDSNGKMRKTEVKEYEKEQTDPSKLVVIEDQKEKRNKKRKKSREVEEEASEDGPKEERRSKKKRAVDVGN